MSKDELKDRLHATHTLQQNTHKKLERLRDKIVESVEKNGVAHNDLLKVVEKCNEEELVKYLFNRSSGSNNCIVLD